MQPRARVIQSRMGRLRLSQVAQALQGHGLPVLQLPRAKNASREMATVMKSFTTSEAHREQVEIVEYWYRGCEGI